MCSAVRVALTEHGRAVVRHAEQRAYTTLNGLLEPLTKADRKQLSALLSRILTRDAQRRFSNERE